MAIHDWTLVDAGIFHDFHLSWIAEIKRTLNSGLLPADYYALAEQHAGGFGPDVLTLQARNASTDAASDNASPIALLTPPKARIQTQTDSEFYRRKTRSVVVRHVSDDRIVAIVEIVSPGNKDSKRAIQAFLDKSRELLDAGVHLLIVDLFPPTKRDPQGIHAAIWREFVDDYEYSAPAEQPLTLVAYEAGLEIKAFLEPVGVGDMLPDMPLVIEPNAAIDVPLEATYLSAFSAVPARWRKVLERVGDA